MNGVREIWHGGRQIPPVAARAVYGVGCRLRSVAEPPDTDSLVADLNAPLQEKFCYISKSERVTQAPGDGEQPDIGGELEIVERPFIESTPASPAGEGQAAE